MAARSRKRARRGKRRGMRALQRRGQARGKRRHGSLRIRASGRGTLKISDLSLEKQFAAPVSGDLNSDGQCDGEDVRLLLDLLLCKPDAALTDPQAADVNADGVLNAKDLTLLKQTALAA